jgi:glycerophosphoryl diester phosphodiesterase
MLPFARTLSPALPRLTRRQALAAACLARMSAAAPKVAVIAHRGEHLANPENTIPAIEAAIRLGADFVEIDVRTTRDGGLVLMHNDSVDATTDGQGAVASLTLPEVRKLRSRGQPVPTLDEALETMRGRCGVYLDAKRITAERIIAALERHKMTDRAVVYAQFNLLLELTSRGFPRLAMPEANSVQLLSKCLQELQPAVIAFDRRDFADDIIQLALAAGKGVFVDRLGGDDHPAAWANAVQRGATGIQTDHPAELLASLQALGRR